MPLAGFYSITLLAPGRLFPGRLWREEHRESTGPFTTAAWPPCNLRALLQSAGSYARLRPLHFFFSALLLSVREPHAFVIEQPTFSRYPAAISGQRPVRADDAMTRHDYAHGVRPIGESHSSDSLGTLEPSCQRGVTERLSHWNLAECRPHATLKDRSAGFHQYPVDCR